MSRKNVTIIKTPKMLIPNRDVDMSKWAVIACDQYTSNKAYWDKVEAYVGDAPSTLKITFPENAEKLFGMAEADAKERYRRFKQQETL